MQSILSKIYQQLFVRHFTMCIFLFGISLSSCKKLLEVDAPITNITSANVYTNDATAVAVLTNIYANLSAKNSNLRQPGLSAISLFGSLYADELTLYNRNDATLLAYYNNDLTNQTGLSFWDPSFAGIFVTNAALEGLNNSTTLTPTIKKQLMGEAYFMRAFYYFYLVNLFGDVPLPVSTNYKLNAVLSRAPVSQVYDLIISDLKKAQDLLSDKYLSADIITTTDERVRPTNWASIALLSRVYLYLGDYQQAINLSTTIINQTSLYSLVSLNEVFLKNSTEAIWQLQPVSIQSSSNTGEGKIFVLPAGGPNTLDYPVYLNRELFNNFEAMDQRKLNWVNNVIVKDTTVVPVKKDTFYYPYKYKIGMITAPTEEYVMVLRLAEQYLIRAEANAQLGNTQQATADLNTIRHRAGLPNISATTVTALMAAIQQERKVELFTEWGHRWLDLKRTKTVDAVMTTATAQKGGIWKSTAQLYPIPLSELQLSVNVKQNPGY